MACESCGKTYVWNPDENIDAKPHVCKTCGLSFSLKIQLKRHCEIHANGEPYVCISCTTNSAQAESKSYNLRLNKKTDNYACDVCGESFTSERSLVRHSVKEHSFFENSDVSTESDSDDYDERPKKKRRSNFSSRKPRGLGNKKKKETSSDKKQHFCSNCFKGFVYESSYEKHIRDCLDQKTSSISSKGSRKSKKAVVIDPMKHDCDVCGKSFTRKSSLEGHMLHHAQADSDDGPDEKDFYDSNADESDSYVSEPKKPKTTKLQVIRKSYTCEKCNFVCFSKPTFEKHSKVHEKEDIITEVKDVTTINIDHASNSNNESNEKPTEEKAKETHLCEICDKVFVTKGRLKKHLQFHVTVELEEGDKELTLPEQPYAPASRRCQKRKKLYGCDVCGRQFAGITCFNKHSLKHHNDHNPDPTDPNFHSKRSSSSNRKKKFVPPMQCEYCGEVFEGKRSVYIKHVHSHTPEVCGICDERFVDRASLREHCKVHIGTEEGRMFVECSQKALEAKLGIMPPEPKVEYIYLMVR